MKYFFMFSRYIIMLRIYFMFSIFTIIFSRYIIIFSRNFLMFSRYFIMSSRYTIKYSRHFILCFFMIWWRPISPKYCWLLTWLTNPYIFFGFVFSFNDSKFRLHISNLPSNNLIWQICIKKLSTKRWTILSFIDTLLCYIGISLFPRRYTLCSLCDLSEFCR